MPELPEVETIKRALESIIVNKKIISIEIFKPKLIKSDLETFKKSLIDKTFLKLTRQGKYLFFHLNDNLVLINHLRMEGKYQFKHPNDNLESHARIIFHLDDGNELVYRDSRMFGMFYLSDESHYQNLDFIKKVGKEPFYLDAKELFNNIKRHKETEIKTVLLNQEVIAGLGNIYVDETLFRSKIHPSTKAKFISQDDCKVILKNAIDVLNLAIAKGGSTIKSYKSINDVDGHFQVDLLVYAKASLPCPNCQKPLKFMKINGRGTTYCSRCQRKKGQKFIAITGLYGSGKSTVTKMFADDNYKIYSCDALIKELYEDKTIQDKIKILFNINSIDFTYIRNAILKNDKLDKKLKNILYPPLKSKILKIFKNHKENVVVEVPLLFDAKMENMFDIIIGVKNELELRNKFIINRDKSLDLKKYYDERNHFLNHLDECDYIIDNNKNLKDLEKEVLKIKKELNI